MKNQFYDFVALFADCEINVRLVSEHFVYCAKVKKLQC